MSDLLRNTIRFILFILIQVYILNKIHLHQYVIPSMYFLFILWLPFSISRMGLMLLSLLLGLSLDYFMLTPGLHAAPCILIGYIRPFLINVLTPRDSSEFNYREPSPKAMGWTPYMVYALILTLLHHLYLTILEWASFGTFLHLLIKVVSMTAISMLLIITTELLFPRKMKFRTNTA